MELRILILGVICLAVFSLGCLQETEETTTTVKETTIIKTYIIPSSCTGFLQVKPIDFKVNSFENGMKLILTNDVGTEISLDFISVDVFGSSCFKNVNKKLRTGKDLQIDITGCSFPDDGDYYRAEITITWTNLASTIQHKTVGGCHGIVGEYLQESKDICRDIEENKWRDMCYHDIGIAINDSEMCGEVKEQLMKDKCYYRVALAKQDSTICEKIENQERRDECYDQVAYSKQDLMICEGIENQEKKDGCYYSVAGLKQDHPICENIKSQSWKDSCYYRVANKRRDPSICDKIIGQRQKDECYHYGATLWIKDPSICDKIMGQNKKDRCYYDIAAAKHDPTLCDKIMGQYLKDWCYKEAKYLAAPTGSLPLDCIGFSQVIPISWKASSFDDEVILNLTNYASRKVRLDTVSLDILGSKCSISPNKELPAGESIQITLTGCAGLSGKAVGDPCKIEIVISYTNLASKNQHESVGRCTGTIK